MPDSQNMWMNPDLKVYLTTVTILGTNDWLKPGMSSKVEIFVSRLADVVYVPVQAVSPAGLSRSWPRAMVSFPVDGARSLDGSF